MIQPTTPYMLRKDGKLLPCGDIHPYLKSFDIDDMDSVLEVDDKDLQWYYENSNDEIKQAVVDFRKNKSINNLNKLNNLVNNEFCKVRTSNHKYKYGGNNGEIYFRLCNTDNFNWFDLIWETVLDEKDYIKTVTIMRDYQTFGTQFDYCKIKGTPIKHMDVDEFLTLQGNPILESLDKDEEEIINNYKNQILEYIGKGGCFLGSPYLTELEDWIDSSAKTPEEEKIFKVHILYAMMSIAIGDKGWDLYKYKNGKEKDFLLLDTQSIDELVQNRIDALEHWIDEYNKYYNLEEQRNYFEYIDPRDYLGDE